MLQRLKDFIKKRKGQVVDGERRIPLHIALTTSEVIKWSNENKKTFREAYERSFKIIKNIFSEQIKYNIPILTIYISHESEKQIESFNDMIQSLTMFLGSLIKDSSIHNNQVKVSVLGKWYDLPPEIVEIIKCLTAETKDYDRFFLNFCINYDGRSEIVDGCRLIARKVQVGKIEPDMITKDIIKENLYSSYFVPPDLLIKSGINRKATGLLLWDSVFSYLYFSKKSFPDFDVSDLHKAIDAWSKGKGYKEE